MQLNADDVVTSLLWEVLAGVSSIAVVDALAWNVLTMWILDGDDEWVATRGDLVSQAVAGLNSEWRWLVSLTSLAS